MLTSHRRSPHVFGFLVRLNGDVVLVLAHWGASHSEALRA